MYIKPTRETKKAFLIFTLICLAAGFLNGLLGAGGGILLVWAFSSCMKDPQADGVRDIFAATLAAVIPITALSACLYGTVSAADIGKMAPLILPAMAGGVIGALLLGKIPTAILKKIFVLCPQRSICCSAFRSDLSPRNSLWMRFAVLLPLQWFL